MRLKWLHKDKLYAICISQALWETKSGVCVSFLVCVFVRVKEVEVEGLGVLHPLIPCALSLMCESGCVVV